MKKTDINKKREKEKQMVSYMIALYCKKNHHNKYNKGSINKNGLCAECQELAEYAGLRSDKCPLWKLRHSVLTARYIAIIRR